MKKYALPLALLGVIALQACNEKMPTTQESAPEAAPASASDPLTSAEQRLSYGIGLSLGQRMAADAIPLDVTAFSLGLSDSLEGKEPRLSQETIAEEMQAFQEKMAAEQQATQAALGEANLAASAAFLEANKAKEGVVVTEPGLQYEVLEAGEGAQPVAEDTVEVHYRGTLIDGTEFDSSYNRGETVKFGVGQVIPGWTEALQLMNVGSKYKLVIPSDLAYGAGGAGQVIGPNATLVFEVELISVVEVEEAPAEAEAAPAG